MKIKLKIILLLFSFLYSCKSDKQNNTIEISHIKQNPEHIEKYSFYRDDGSLDKTLEFINLCGKKYLNQGIYFTKNKDTIFSKSNYYKLIIEKNEIKLNELTKITITYKPLLKNSVSGLLLSKENIDLNFCNLNKSKFDTIFFVDNKIEFYQKFKKRGKKNIGGYILEMDKELKNKTYNERRVYLSISLEVK